MDHYVALFGRFWARDRLVMRRIRALGSLDAEFEASLRQRDGWRHGGITTLMLRLLPDMSEGARNRVIDVLYTLTSFSTFDTLAGDESSPADATKLVQELARMAVNAAS
jgi:hypothetical protein